MKKMFNIILAASVCFLFSFATGRAEGTSIGGGLALGTKSDGFGSSALGIDLRGVHIINDKVRIGGDFEFFFAEGDATFWILDGNVHYIFVDDDVVFYGLAGLGILYVSYPFISPFTGTEDSISDTNLALNLGGGVDFPTKFGAVFAELKFQIEDGNQIVIAGGVRFDI